MQQTDWSAGIGGDDVILPATRVLVRATTVAGSISSATLTVEWQVSAYFSAVFTAAIALA